MEKDTINNMDKEAVVTNIKGIMDVINERLDFNEDVICNNSKSYIVADCGMGAWKSVVSITKETVVISCVEDFNEVGFLTWDISNLPKKTLDEILFDLYYYYESMVSLGKILGVDML